MRHGALKWVRLCGVLVCSYKVANGWNQAWHQIHPSSEILSTVWRMVSAVGIEPTTY